MGLRRRAVRDGSRPLFPAALLLSGNTFLRRLVEILLTFRDKRQAIEISQQIEHDISAYLITITIMNALVGLATACVMRLCGLGDPILWGAAAFSLNYIPFLGPAIGVVMFILLRRADERGCVPARSGKRRRAGPQALVQAVAQRRRLKEPPRPFVPPTTGFIARRRADCGTVSTRTDQSFDLYPATAKMNHSGRSSVRPKAARAE